MKIGKTNNALFTDDIITYVENLKESTRILLDLIKNYNKVAGCEFNIQKLIYFLYASMNR